MGISIMMTYTSIPYTDGQHRTLESLWIKIEMVQKDSQRNPAIDAQTRYRNSQNDQSIIQIDQRKKPSYITFNSPSLSKRTIIRDWSPIGHCLGVPVRISCRDLEEVLSRTSTRLTDTRRKLLLAHRGQRPDDCLFSKRLLASLPSCHLLRIEGSPGSLHLEERGERSTLSDMGRPRGATRTSANAA